MNLIDYLIPKNKNKSQESETQHLPVGVDDPGIQQDKSTREEVFDLLKNIPVNNEKLANLVNQAELEAMKLRLRKLEEENIELAKRPSLADYNYRDIKIQHLTMQLNNVKQVTVSIEEYEQLEQETSYLKQELQTMITKVEGLENIIRDYDRLNSDLQLQLEQLHVTMLDTKIYDGLEEKYDSLQTAYVALQNEYEQQIQQNKQLHLELKQVQAQSERMPQLLFGELPGKFISSEEAYIEVEKYDVIDTFEDTPFEQLGFDEEEEERLAFDEEFFEELSDEKELLIEREVDEAQMVQAISDVLLKTVPTIEQGVTSGFPVFDASSFLLRDDESEHDYLRKVINKIIGSMHEIRNVEFNSTYEIDYATAYSEGIIRKQKYDHNRRLHSMKDRPYIGRVDYVTTSGAETMYIGEQGIEGQVISWKAEAASLYYLRIVGQPIAHKTLGDVITDYIRQIDIQYGNIKTLHSPITVTSHYLKDEGLVSALSSKRGLDMQSIVATLQREQYEMIRLPMTKPIIIQGSAGSGKSAIALHRLSYLLYKYQNLKADRVAILGPNEAFLKHIQHVLPTLGDFGIKQSTFLGMACDILMISLSKVKRHQAAELDVIKMKGSLDFRHIVQETTMRMFNDLRIWAKPYTVKSISIPIVPILREMEKFPHLSLKDRDNQYFNFFSRGLQQEIQTENEVKQQYQEWVKEKAKSIEKQKVMILPLYQDDFITPEIAELGRIWVENVEAYINEPSKGIKKQAESSRLQFIDAIKKAVQLKLKEHVAVLQPLISQNIDEMIIAQTWQHHIQLEVRKAEEAAILDLITKQPYEVLSVDDFIETSLVQQKLEELRNHVLAQLANVQQAFFKSMKEMLQQALLAEVLMRIEQSYYNQIIKALKTIYDLEYSFKKIYSGYAFEKELELSTAERESLHKYVKKHLELDHFDCFDEAIRMAKLKGLLADDYQSFETFYEDLPALLHITRLMHGVSKEHRLSYLIVDEAQDYMPYEIVELNALTQKNGLMLIGDLGQNLNQASSLQDWHTLDVLIGDPAYFELQATYRSTAQIVDVGNKIIQPFANGKYKLSIETFRDGEEVKWVGVTSATEEQELIKILEEAIFTHQYESIAVVVKDETLLKHYHYMIDPYFTVAIQTATELPTNAKVILTTPTAVKGLEFEAVVIARFNEYKSTDFDRKLAYVATSRALHQLYITLKREKNV